MYYFHRRAYNLCGTGVNSLKSTHINFKRKSLSLKKSRVKLGGIHSLIVKFYQNQIFEYKKEKTNDAHRHENLEVEIRNQTLSKEAITRFKNVYYVDSFTRIYVLLIHKL